MTKPLINLGSIYIDNLQHTKYIIAMERVEKLLKKKQKWLLDGEGSFTDANEKRLNEADRKSVV